MRPLAGLVEAIKKSNRNNLDIDELKMQAKSRHITAKIYSEVVLDFDGDMSDVSFIEDEYKRRVCKLPSEDLDLILRTFIAGLVDRRIDTIDAIISEIAERELIKCK